MSLSVFVFSTVQSYCDFHTLTIPFWGHSAYHKYGISSKIAVRSSWGYYNIYYLCDKICQMTIQMWMKERDLHDYITQIKYA